MGLAAEAAAAQAERTGNGSGPAHGRAGAASSPAVASPNGAPIRSEENGWAHYGTCQCGLPATSTCGAGCGRPICSAHLLNRASRLAWPGPYRSEREHTAYLRGFWASSAPLCTWCREAAGESALAALAPVAALPDGLLDRLAALQRHPHDHPADAWPQTVQRYGGTAAVVRSLAPALATRRPAQEFEGRRRGDVLVGTPVGPVGIRGVYELVDAVGTVWTVRPLSSGLVRKRRAWAWERAPEERVAELLARIVELAAR